MEGYEYVQNNFNKPLNKSEAFSFYRVLRVYLKISRSIIRDIHDRNVLPNLKQMCSTLTTFIGKNFYSISRYTSSCSIDRKYLCEIRILCQALSMLLSFYNLRYLAFSEMNVGLKNAVIMTSMISLSLYASSTSYCFEQDIRNFPELCQPNSRNVTPYFSLSLSLTGELFYRSLITFYGLVYNTLTLLQSGLVCAVGKHSVEECNLETLDVDEKVNISFSVYFKVFCEIVSRISNDKNAKFKLVSGRSYAFITLLALAKSSQNTVKKTLESKSNQKNPWISPLQQFSGLELFDNNISYGRDDGMQVALQHPMIITEI